MHKVRILAASCSALAMASSLVWATPGWAQESAASAAQSMAVGEVVVTARKRQESILNVPVVVTALPQATLQRFQVQNMKDIATLVPGLTVGESVLSIGTQISLRGIGTTAFDPGIDQSVVLNVDGQQFSQGLAFGSGFFDMGQVEVLKGPQALFFGKSSPGGVISIRTADPTDKFEVIGRAMHEFEAGENRGDIIVSGPITETLKGRLAATYGDEQGFYDNPGRGVAALGSRDPVSSKLFPRKDYQIRGTLLWNPTSQFDARLKVNQVYDRTLYAGIQQYVQCPEGTGPVPGLGIPFMGGEDCKRDRTIPTVDYNPASFPVGLENNGTPFLQNTQTYGSLELNYRVRPDLTLTSVTTYYLLHSNSMHNTTNTTEAASLASVTNHFQRHDTTEELRASSDFAGPVNFTAGAFFQRGFFGDQVFLGGNGAIGLPPALVKETQEVDTKTNSVFGQLRWKIIPQVEVAAGARWTGESRADNAFNLITGTRVPIPLITPEIKSNNTSPEVSITYKPSDNWTLFGNLKRGYKSGSYDVATPASSTVDNSFGDEKTEGYELGVKTRLLDRQVAMNLAWYDYRYTGLQIGGVSATQGLPVIHTINAGSAITYGIDWDAAYRPEQIPGLGLNAAVNWNEGHFKTLNNAECYGGQTIALGCNLAPDAAGVFQAQDLSGSVLVRAPRWQANFGFDYTTDIGNGLTLVVASNNHYSSKYNTNLDLPYFQKGFIKTDLSLTLQGPRDRWEVALIANNIGNQLTSSACSNFNGQAGGPFLGLQQSGTNTSGPAGIDEIGCFMDRGREVWLRLTLKPFN
jgi:iron complex outermembrane receptor protein